MTDKEKIKHLENENSVLKEKLYLIEIEKIESFNRKIWFSKKISNVLLGLRLKSAIVKAIEEFNDNRKLSTDTIAELSTSIIYRLTRIGVITLFFGFLPSLLLFCQNRLINTQNDKLEQQTDLFTEQKYLLEIQNERIEQQTYLSEATRRSSQVQILGSIFTDISKELNGKKAGQRRLSKELAARIISLSEAMKPYRYMENDTLIPKPLSPERGQLLITLVKSELDKNYVDSLFLLCNFEYSDLRDAWLYEAYIPNTRLSFSNLKETKLTLANLTGSWLDNAYMKEVILNEANLTNVNLSNSNLSMAEIKDANLSSTILKNALVHGAEFDRSDLSKTYIGFVKFVDTTALARLERLKPMLTKKGLNLVDNTWGKFVSLDSVKIGYYDWIEYLRDTLKMDGMEVIDKLYKVSSIIDTTSNKKIPILVRQE